MDKLIPKLQKLTQNLWWTWKPEVRTAAKEKLGTGRRGMSLV